MNARITPSTINVHITLTSGRWSDHITVFRVATLMNFQRYAGQPAIPTQPCRAIPSASKVCGRRTAGAPLWAADQCAGKSFQRVVTRRLASSAVR